MSREPSGAASRSAPAAVASGSVPMAVLSSSADERFRSDEVPDHGVKRVRWSPYEQDTKEFDPNEPSNASVQSRCLKRLQSRRRKIWTTQVHNSRPLPQGRLVCYLLPFFKRSKNKNERNAFLTI